MRISILLAALLLCLATITAFAQEALPLKQEKDEIKTLFRVDKERLTIGGYAGFDAKYAMFDKSWNLMTGIRGGILFNHSYLIGFSGYGLMYNRSVKGITGKNLVWDEDIETGYGGLLMEYHFFPKKVVHFSIGTIIGTMGIVFEPLYDYRNIYVTNFIVEPELAFYVNIFRHLRLSVNCSYRFVPGLHKRGITGGDYSGFSVGASIQGGMF